MTDTRDCVHDWQRVGVSPDVVHVLDFELDLTDAVVSCARCEALALLHMLGWRTSGSRVFGVSRLPADGVHTFLRNMASEFCDLTRKRDEAEMLVSLAEPAMGISSMRVNPLVTVDYRPLDNGTGPGPLGMTAGHRSWRDRNDSDYWLTLFEAGAF